MAIHGYSVASATTSGAGMPSATSIGNANYSDSSSSGALSSGAKIAIGVGVGVGAVAIIAIVSAIYFFRRGRKPQQSTEDTTDPSNLDQHEDKPPAELHAQATLSELGGKNDAPELPGNKTAPIELTGASKKPRTELPGPWSPAEME